MHLPLFFSISGGELLVVLLFVLLFFGSKGLPGIARGMGRTLRQVRDASNEVQREITRSAMEVKRGLEENDPTTTATKPPPDVGTDGTPSGEDPKAS
jgi:sec-independent protein translocase protein TatA